VARAAAARTHITHVGLSGQIRFFWWNQALAVTDLLFMTLWFVFHSNGIFFVFRIDMALFEIYSIICLKSIQFRKGYPHGDSIHGDSFLRGDSHGDSTPIDGKLWTSPLDWPIHGAALHCFIPGFQSWDYTRE
jgi:hypothetical protein